MLNIKKILSLTLAAALLLGLWGCKNPEKPEETQPTQEQTQPDPTTDPDATTPLVPLDPTAPTNGITLTPNSQLNLGSNLQITDIGSYTGIYMEDGKDDFVDNVFMIVLQNKSQQDLQLAHIELIYDSFTAVFEATNIPAGESAVLLEKNRHEYVNQPHTGVELSNLTFFSDPMGLRQNQVSITEGNGNLTVTNLTDSVINEVTIYYKNSATDIFYGGITYRTRLTDSMEPGESKTLIAAHFYPGASTVVDVRIQ